MTKTDVAVLGCRLISIWVGVSALVRHIATAPIAASWLHNMVGSQPITWAYLGIVLPNVLRAVLAVVLWYAAPALWRLVSKNDAAEDTTQWTATDLLGAALFLCGTSMLLVYLAETPSVLVRLQPMPPMSARGGVLDLLSRFKSDGQVTFLSLVIAWLPTIIPIALSACLVYFSRPAAQLILDQDRRPQ